MKWDNKKQKHLCPTNSFLYKLLFNFKKLNETKKKVHFHSVIFGYIYVCFQFLPSTFQKQLEDYYVRVGLCFLSIRQNIELS